jgi:hypothetical protein
VPEIMNPQIKTAYDLLNENFLNPLWTSSLDVYCDWIAPYTHKYVNRTIIDTLKNKGESLDHYSKLCVSIQTACEFSLKLVDDLVNNHFTQTHPHLFAQIRFAVFKLQNGEIVFNHDPAITKFMEINYHEQLDEESIKFADLEIKTVFNTSALAADITQACSDEEKKIDALKIIVEDLAILFVKYENLNKSFAKAKEIDYTPFLSPDVSMGLTTLANLTHATFRYNAQFIRRANFLGIIKSIKNDYLNPHDVNHAVSGASDLFEYVYNKYQFIGTVLYNAILSPDCNEQEIQQAINIIIKPHHLSHLFNTESIMATCKKYRELRKTLSQDQLLNSASYQNVKGFVQYLQKARAVFYVAKHALTLNKEPVKLIDVNQIAEKAAEFLTDTFNKNVFIESYTAVLALPLPQQPEAKKSLYADLLTVALTALTLMSSASKNKLRENPVFAKTVIWSDDAKKIKGQLMFRVDKVESSVEDVYLDAEEETFDRVRLFNKFIDRANYCELIISTLYTRYIQNNDDKNELSDKVVTEFVNIVKHCAGQILNNNKNSKKKKSKPITRVPKEHRLAALRDCLIHSPFSGIFNNAQILEKAVALEDKSYDQALTYYEIFHDSLKSLYHFYNKNFKQWQTDKFELEQSIQMIDTIASFHPSIHKIIQFIEPQMFTNHLKFMYLDYGRISHRQGELLNYFALLKWTLRSFSNHKLDANLEIYTKSYLINQCGSYLLQCMGYNATEKSTIESLLTEVKNVVSSLLPYNLDIPADLLGVIKSSDKLIAEIKQTYSNVANAPSTIVDTLPSVSIDPPDTSIAVIQIQEEQVNEEIESKDSPPPALTPIPEVWPNVISEVESFITTSESEKDSEDTLASDTDIASDNTAVVKRSDQPDYSGLFSQLNVSLQDVRHELDITKKSYRALEAIVRPVSLPPKQKHIRYKHFHYHVSSLARILDESAKDLQDFKSFNQLTIEKRNVIITNIRFVRTSNEKLHAKVKVTQSELMVERSDKQNQHALAKLKKVQETRRLKVERKPEESKPVEPRTPLELNILVRSTSLTLDSSTSATQVLQTSPLARTSSDTKTEATVKKVVPSIKMSPTYTRCLNQALICLLNIDILFDNINKPNSPSHHYFALLYNINASYQALQEYRNCSNRNIDLLTEQKKSISRLSRFTNFYHLSNMLSLLVLGCNRNISAQINIADGISTEDRKLLIKAYGFIEPKLAARYMVDEFPLIIDRKTEIFELLDNFFSAEELGVNVINYDEALVHCLTAIKQIINDNSFGYALKYSLPAEFVKRFSFQTQALFILTQLCGELSPYLFNLDDKLLKFLKSCELLVNPQVTADDFQTVAFARTLSAEIKAIYTPVITPANNLISANTKVNRYKNRLFPIFSPKPGSRVDDATPLSWRRSQPPS